MHYLCVWSLSVVVPKNGSISACTIYLYLGIEPARMRGRSGTVGWGGVWSLLQSDSSEVRNFTMSCDASVLCLCLLDMRVCEL